MRARVGGFLLTVLLSLGHANAEGIGSAGASERSPARVFEIRTYTTAPGKLADLHKRFREHTMKLFERHGMTNIGYWSPQDSPLADNTLIYVLSHESRDAAKKSWAAFGADPQWQRVKQASEANGPIVTKVEAIFMDATDYSPMK
jgi:hypothetical protein